MPNRMSLPLIAAASFALPAMAQIAPSESKSAPPASTPAAASDATPASTPSGPLSGDVVDQAPSMRTDTATPPTPASDPTAQTQAAPPSANAGKKSKRAKSGR